MEHLFPTSPQNKVPIEQGSELNSVLRAGFSCQDRMEMNKEILVRGTWMYRENVFLKKLNSELSIYQGVPTELCSLLSANAGSMPPTYLALLWNLAPPPPPPEAGRRRRGGGGRRTSWRTEHPELKATTPSENTPVHQSPLTQPSQPGHGYPQRIPGSVLLNATDQRSNRFYRASCRMIHETHYAWDVGHYTVIAHPIVLLRTLGGAPPTRSRRATAPNLGRGEGEHTCRLAEKS